MKYAAIADWATEGEFSVKFMCAQLGVARSGYYRWRASGPCQRERTDAELSEVISDVHHKFDGVECSQFCGRPIRLPIG